MIQKARPIYKIDMFDKNIKLNRPLKRHRTASQTLFSINIALQIKGMDNLVKELFLLWAQKLYQLQHRVSMLTFSKSYSLFGFST